MVFRFRMLSDENDRFVRDYEVSYDTSSLEYEPCMASFFTADDRWNRLREFTLMDMGAENGEGPEPMERIALGQILHSNRDRLIYLFDLFGDRAYYLELTGAAEAQAGAEYPREIFARAEAPDQYDPSKTRADEEEGSMFDEAMDDFREFEGDDAYDDE